jgi:hypothetical protein
MLANPMPPFSPPHLEVPVAAQVRQRERAYSWHSTSSRLVGAMTAQGCYVFFFICCISFTEQAWDLAGRERELRLPNCQTCQPANSSAPENLVLFQIGCFPVLYASASIYSRSPMKITLLLSAIAVLATSSSIPNAKTEVTPEPVGLRAWSEPIYSRVLGANNKCSVRFCHAPYHPNGWCPYESGEVYTNISNLEQNLTCGCTCEFN